MKCEEVALDRRSLWAAAGVLLLLVLARPAFAGSGPNACPAKGGEITTVAAVDDAETLRLVDGSLVRLAAIDVPAWAFPAAELALAKLAPARSVITLAPTGDRADRYGRHHAFAFLADGRQLQAALVGEGAARARWLPDESACFAALVASEDKARRAGLGIWARPQAILRADDPSLVHQSGLYEVVAGRLVSVGHGAQMTFLDFGEDYRHDFTVMVSATVAKALTAALGPVDALVKKQLLVRGVIENDHGATIRVNDAAEIELIDDLPKP